MRGIIKNPALIRQNTYQTMADKFTLMQRLQFYRERDVKLNLMKLFLRQYEL